MEYPLQKGGNILNETIIPKIISMSGFQLPPFNRLILRNIQNTDKTYGRCFQSWINVNINISNVKDPVLTNQPHWHCSSVFLLLAIGFLLKLKLNQTFHVHVIINQKFRILFIYVFQVQGL